MTPEDTAYLEWLEDELPQIPVEEETHVLIELVRPKLNVVQLLLVLAAAEAALAVILYVILT